MAEALALVKQQLLITTDEFDTVLTNLMNACLIDLGMAGIVGEQAIIGNVFVLNTVATYVYMNFKAEPSEYDRLKKSYDEAKAQMSMATGYTVW